MLPLGGPISEFLATLGTVIGGGAAIGSLLGGVLSLVTGLRRGQALETAGVCALVAGAAAAAILALEETTGLP